MYTEMKGIFPNQIELYSALLEVWRETGGIIWERPFQASIMDVFILNPNYTKCAFT